MFLVFSSYSTVIFNYKILCDACKQGLQRDSANSTQIQPNKNGTMNCYEIKQTKVIFQVLYNFNLNLLYVSLSKNYT